MLFRLSIFVSIIFLFSSFYPIHNKEIEEYNAKALFIFNFTKYIEWNNMNNLSEFNISVYKSSPIIQPLKHIATNRKVENKKMIINEIRSFPEFPEFQILFIPEKTPIEHCQILKKNQQYKNVLIISENTKHFKDFSSINFLIEENKIKFEINISNSQFADLKISAQLLKLAVNIKK